jgi:hypothetical protein
MARAYLDMTAEETNKFQVLIKHYREARLAKWQAVQAAQLFDAEWNAMSTLGGELEAPADAIPHDARQGAKSIFSSDPSWNALLNEHVVARDWVAAEVTGSPLAAYKASIGADTVA